MTEAPETIWTCTHVGEYGYYFPDAVEAEGEYGGTAVNYRRADLPLTTAQIRADERVRALVEALGAMVGRHTLYCGGPDLPHAGHTDVKIMGMANTALAQLKEPKP